MKNLLSVILLAGSLLLGMTSVNAQELSQNQDRPEAIAKSIVADLSSKLDLNGDQQRSLFRAYTAYQSNIKKHVTGKNLSEQLVRDQKGKFDETLRISVQKALTDTQYKQWLTLQDM